LILRSQVARLVFSETGEMWMEERAFEAEAPLARLDAVASLALRAVRRPDTAIVGLIAATHRDLGARRCALYVIPSGSGPVQLLAMTDENPMAIEAPGAVDEATSASLRALAASAPDDDDAWPGSWTSLPRPVRATVELAAGRCMFVVSGAREPSAVPHAAGPLGLLASALMLQRRVDALERELGGVRQERALLAAGLQHDLRTPLTSIIGSARMLEKRHDELTGDERAQLIEMIERQAQRMHGMIDETLDAPATDIPPRARLVDIEEIAHRVAHVARAARGGEVHVEAGGLFVRTDPARLERILLNLVDNALRYSPDGRAHVIAEPGPGGVVVTVADQGPGVHPSVVPSLFEAYSTDPERTDGFGLGLSSVARLVADIGGRVTYTRRAGWTRFSVSIPAAEGA
jgi:signal transduction histidine kinase